ncbi:hypothetical protein HAX54_049120, partial [Datura stramonium]|nr:hypothetical protein [Datura stramonium]
SSSGAITCVAALSLLRRKRQPAPSTTGWRACRLPSRAPEQGWHKLDRATKRAIGRATREPVWRYAQCAILTVLWHVRGILVMWLHGRRAKTPSRLYGGRRSLLPGALACATRQ